jgi:hypothetical protein
MNCAGPPDRGGRCSHRADPRGAPARCEDTKRQVRGLNPDRDAAVMAVSQALVSQIEHGKVTEVDAIRDYIQALGGTVDVVAQAGDWTVRDA